MQRTTYLQLSRCLLAFCLMALAAIPHSGAAQTQWYQAYGLNKTTLSVDEFSTPFAIYRTPATAPKAPTLVMIHGVAGSAEDFAPLLANFLDYKLVLFDLPGFSTSDEHSDLLSPYNYAIALAKILPSLSQQPAVVIGHSMGGNIAIQLVANNPLLAAKLVLIDAAGILNKYSYSKYITQHQVAKIPFLSQQQQRTVSGIIDSANAHVPQFLGDILLSKAGRQTLLRNQGAIIAAVSVMEQNIGHDIRRLALPTLIIWGEDDAVMPYQVGETLHYMLPHSELTVQPGLGHSPQKEAPQRVSSQIQHFLQHGLSPTATLSRVAANDVLWDCSQRGDLVLDTQRVYQNLRIENCPSATLSGLYAAQLTVINSNLVLKDLHLDNKEDMALTLQHANLEIWGASINSQRGIELLNSRLDITGAQIVLEAETAYSSDEKSVLMASVTEVRTANSIESWHGFISH